MEKEDISSSLSPLYSPSQIKRGNGREDDRGWGRCVEKGLRCWDGRVEGQGLGENK